VIGPRPWTLRHGSQTASFSQCRRLTVASVKKGVASCLRWDLDELAADPDSGWLLFEGPAIGSKPFIAGLKGKKAGTVVLWETMDRVVTSGYRHLSAASLKPKHVEGLVARWQTEGMAVGTIKNRMAELRWWAEKIGKQNVIARDNEH